MSFTKPLAITAGIVVLGAVYCGYSSNKFIQPYNDALGAISQVQNVEDISWRKLTTMASTVSSYAEHEKSTFVGVANGRGGISGNGNSAIPPLPPKPDALKASPDQVMKNPELQKQLVEANGNMTTYINAAVEAYPALKADKLYTDLMTTINGSNDRISQERRRQIQYTKVYNVQRQNFPQVIVAKLMGYNDIPYYQAPESHQDAPILFQK